MRKYRVDFLSTWYFSLRVLFFIFFLQLIDFVSVSVLRRTYFWGVFFQLGLLKCCRCPFLMGLGTMEFYEVFLFEAGGSFSCGGKEEMEMTHQYFYHVWQFWIS